MNRTFLATPESHPGLIDPAVAKAGDGQFAGEPPVSRAINKLIAGGIRKVEWPPWR